MEDNNVKEIAKGGRTRDSLRKSIENELNEARLKEAKGKLRGLVVDLASAQKVVRAKEAEIEALYEDH